MKKFFIAVCVLLSVTFVYAEEKEYSHTQVALTGYVPYFGEYAVSATQLFLPPELTSHVISSGSLLLNIPATIVNPSYTVTGSALTSALWASGIFLENKPAVYGNPSLSNTLMNMGFKGNMWLQYKGYEKARSLCSSDIYPEYENLSFRDAFLACYDPKILSKKSVWVPIVSFAGLAIGSSLMQGMDNSVFTTGESYIGNYKVPVLSGFASVFVLSCLNYTLTGIGEEAMFRGMGYEEMKVSMGLWPAKIIDAVGFPAVHIPQQIITGYDTSIMLSAFVLQSSTSFLLQWIYDQGGLKDSIAAHMWFDVVASTVSYLFTSGTENNNFALNISFSTKL